MTRWWTSPSEEEMDKFVCLLRHSQKHLDFVFPALRCLHWVFLHSSLLSMRLPLWYQAMVGYGRPATLHSSTASFPSMTSMSANGVTKSGMVLFSTSLSIPSGSSGMDGIFSNLALERGRVFEKNILKNAFCR